MMSEFSSHPSQPATLSRTNFPRLLEILDEQGYAVHAPVVFDGGVTWERIHQVEDLPIGWRDYQHPGTYRLERTDSSRYFDILHGADSLKRQTFAPREPLLKIERKKEGLAVQPLLPSPEKRAFLGVRACDLAGLLRQERIFLHDQFPDPSYQARRNSLLIIAVNCTRSLETCFCVAMQTGPRADSGYDLSLTELDEDFVIRAGSPAGEDILNLLPRKPATPHFFKEEERSLSACARSQTRTVPYSQLPQALYEAHEHPQWEAIASRCLACTNCTMVCPTCFCHSVEDTQDLSLTHSKHVRVWDSCFTENHAAIHGKNFRPTIKDRYRMWLTHKLATWIDQFGSSGCVGCGRCITWCPVGIDLTQELAILLGGLSEKEKTES